MFPANAPLDGQSECIYICITVGTRTYGMNTISPFHSNSANKRWIQWHSTTEFYLLNFLFDLLWLGKNARQPAFSLNSTTDSDSMAIASHCFTAVPNFVCGAYVAIVCSFSVMARFCARPYAATSPKISPYITHVMHIKSFASHATCHTLSNTTVADPAVYRNPCRNRCKKKTDKMWHKLQTLVCELTLVRALVFPSHVSHSSCSGWFIFHLPSDRSHSACRSRVSSCVVFYGKFCCCCCCALSSFLYQSISPKPGTKNWLSWVNHNEGTNLSKVRPIGRPSVK